MTSKAIKALISPSEHYMVLQHFDGFVPSYDHDPGYAQGPWHVEYYLNTSGGWSLNSDPQPGVFPGWPEGFDT